MTKQKSIDSKNNSEIGDIAEFTKNSSLLLLDNVKKRFADGGIDKTEYLDVLCGVDMKVEKGEIVAIIGGSGSGKTTLLQITGTLDRPSSGQVLLEGINVHKLSEKAKNYIRTSKIGFIFQFHNLINDMTALENVMMPALISGKKSRRSNAYGLTTVAGNWHD